MLILLEGGGGGFLGNSIWWESLSLGYSLPRRKFPGGSSVLWHRHTELTKSLSWSWLAAQTMIYSKLCTRANVSYQFYDFAEAISWSAAQTGSTTLTSLAHHTPQSLDWGVWLARLDFDFRYQGTYIWGFTEYVSNNDIISLGVKGVSKNARVAPHFLLLRLVYGASMVLWQISLSTSFEIHLNFKVPSCSTHFLMK